MKRILAAILVPALIMGLCAVCAEARKTEIVVFAAPSMTETLTGIEKLYE